MKRVAILAFCLTSAWTAASFAQGAGDCTLSAKNNEYDNSCGQCRSDAPDGGFATCQSTRRSQGKGFVCSQVEDGGVTVEIWCSPAAVTTAKPSGCSLQTAGGQSPIGALVTLGGIGLTIVLGRRWRRR